MEKVKIDILKIVIMNLTQKLVQECFIDKNHRYGFGFIKMPTGECSSCSKQQIDIKKVGDKILIGKSWYMESDLIALARAFHGMDLLSDPDLVSLCAETEILNANNEKTETIFLKRFKHNPLTKETKNVFYGLVSPI